MSWREIENSENGSLNMPVRVVISPSQSSFFAGEPFSATVTFTNVAAPPDSSTTPARGHKRAAHSISSAPLARPPTSPGLPPRRSSTFFRDSLPARKGLIGPPISYDKHLFLETRQSPTSPRISVPLSRTDTLALSSDHPHARKSSILDGQFSLDALSPTTSIPPQPRTPPLSLKTISESLPSSPLSISSSPTTPRVSSPLSSSYSQPGSSVQAYPSMVETTPRPHSHHRRFSQQVQIGLGHPTPPPPPPPQSAFASTFPKSTNTELILYSYAQLVGTVHVLPESNGVPPMTQEQSLRMNRIRRMLMRRKAVVGGGSMDISRSLHPHRSNWGSIGGGGIQPPPPPPSSSSSRGALQQQQLYQHGRSTSFSQSLLSLLSPSASSGGGSSSTPTSSFDTVPMPGGGYGLGLGISTHPPTTTTNNNLIDEVVDPEMALPTFEAQPSMLAVDLVLAPGESKSYTYVIKLPDVLPPTYRGRALSFSYELVVGTCRAGGGNGNGLGVGVGVNSVSRVMKVPIRVYNHVTVDHPQRPYDILWPVKRTRNYGYGREKMMMMNIPETQGRVVEENENEDGEVSKLVGMRRGKSSGVRLSSAGRKGEDEACLNELKLYTKRLLTSLPPPPPPPPPTTTTNGKVDDEDNEVVSSPLSTLSESSSASLPPSTTPTTIASYHNDDSHSTNNNNEKVEVRNRIIEGDRREEEEDKNLITGCREAVEILTRVPKKASYDVNKEGVKVAVLTFTKSAYRLGETVCGVVELNERVGRSRVVQLSAILEAHEVLPKTIVTRRNDNNNGNGKRVVYAEHYASFMLGVVRTTFALDIPSDASPGFQVKIDDDDRDDHDDGDGFSTAVGGLEWKIRLCLLVGVASQSQPNEGQGVALFRSLERDGGRGEWGSSWCAPKRFVPLEKRKKEKIGKTGKVGMMMDEGTRSWTRILVDSMWGAVTGVGVEDDQDEESSLQEEEQEQEDDISPTTTTTTMKWRDYDGIKPDLGGGIGQGVDFSGDDEGETTVWEEVRLETVECEVPIKVWPGNTAFRAVDVVFDV